MENIEKQVKNSILGEAKTTVIDQPIRRLDTVVRL
jgi:hypothetical protein